jgi:TonB family protein
MFAQQQEQRDESRVSLPMVIGAAVPFYPIGPRTVNIQGTVRIKVSTDGERVIDATIEDDGGNPALGRAAQENARTWQFSKHHATTFIVNYHYILVERLEDIKSNMPNAKVILGSPTDVEIYAQRWPGTVDTPFELKRGKRQHASVAGGRVAQPNQR